MVPTINSMMVIGLVNLPRMMTGQILAGARPLDAVRYPIVIMVMLVAAAALGSLGVVLLSYCCRTAGSSQYATSCNCGGFYRPSEKRPNPSAKGAK